MAERQFSNRLSLHVSSGQADFAESLKITNIELNFCDLSAFLAASWI